MNDLYGYVSRKFFVELGDLSVLTPEEAALRRDPFAALNHGLSRRVRNTYAFACGAESLTADDITTLKENGLREGDEVMLYLPEPGTFGGKPFSYWSVTSFQAALELDGFQAVSHEICLHKVIPDGFNLVAPFLRTGTIRGGYHFYRFHKETGTWFHKEGWYKPATNLDHDDENIITNPRMIDHKFADTFLGYYLAPERKRPNTVITDLKGNVLLGSVPKVS